MIFPDRRGQQRTARCGLPFPLAPLAAVVVTGLLGVLVGLPAVKVRGLNLAIVTLGAAVAIQELLFKWDWFVGDIGRTEIPDTVPKAVLHSPLELLANLRFRTPIALFGAHLPSWRPLRPRRCHTLILQQIIILKSSPETKFTFELNSNGT